MFNLNTEGFNPTSTVMIYTCICSLPEFIFHNLIFNKKPKIKIWIYHSILFQTDPGLPPPPSTLDVSLIEDVEFPALSRKWMDLMRSHLTVNDESGHKLQDVEIPEAIPRLPLRSVQKVSTSVSFTKLNCSL